ncbi:hypothetical protein OG426_43295 [Streptomyces canus]|uniref:hypothetical protein n=1 Tax=Streptomyces canus TaxID=58343 RepID=UPI003864FAD0|nr:hypothetical protein OG426_43295 [Streptomyces canus]
MPLPTAKKPGAKKNNHGKRIAADAEAKKTFAAFEHRGLTFKIPHPRNFPLQVLMIDDELVATQLILGQDQWAAYLSAEPDIEDFGEFATKMSEAQGRDDDSGN